MCVQPVQNSKRYHYRFPTNPVISPYPTDPITKPIETTRRSLGQIEKKSPQANGFTLVIFSRQ